MKDHEKAKKDLEKAEQQEKEAEAIMLKQEKMVLHNFEVAQDHHKEQEDHRHYHKTNSTTKNYQPCKKKNLMNLKKEKESGQLDKTTQQL